MDSTTPTWLTVVIAVTGLIGILLAPVIQARIAAGVEEKRQASEQRRFESERTQRRNELLFEAKRSLFVRILALGKEGEHALEDHAIRLVKDPKTVSPSERIEKWAADWLALALEVDILDANLHLLMAPVYTKSTWWTLAALGAEGDLANERLHRARLAYLEDLAALRSAMRKSLGIEEPPANN